MEYEADLENNLLNLVERLKMKSYKPQPSQRVYIQKANGRMRPIGIVTYEDKLVQSVLGRVLSAVFGPKFRSSMYGFRPKRCCHDALRALARLVEWGKTNYVVDVVIKKFFDTVNHDMLINMIREHVSDEAVILLIRKFLKSGVMVGGIVSVTTECVPQGGPLSPLCSNIYLTPFDRRLESRGHKFVRYADDANIYVKSRRAAERVMESCTQFLD